uniref:V-SNARE coiled-coil homology domain-containing protein n=1 Tax=Monodelphis domestica TaxID=13616 RepID=A0A5F8H8D8_MONDO
MSKLRPKVVVYPCHQLVAEPKLTFKYFDIFWTNAFGITLTFIPQVVDIMRVNVDKVLERDQKLSELDDRADALQAGASQFESSAAKLKRKYWWKNCKMMIMMGAICAIIVVIIVTAAATAGTRPRGLPQSWMSVLWL